MRGKEIYNTGRGLTPDIVGKEILESKGLTEDIINYSYVSAASELAPMILSGKVKYAIVPEPVLSMVMSKDSKIKILLDINEKWMKLNNSDRGFPQSTLLIKREFYSSNKKFCKQVIKNIEESIEWVNDNPNEAEIVSERIGVTVNKDILTTAINRGNLKFHYIKDTKSKYIKLFELIDTKESNKEGNSTYEEVFIKE